MTAAGASEPKRGRPRDPPVRTAVLTAASRQLTEVGFAALTMDGITAESRIAKRTLYRWWPSKSAVLAEAILSGFIPVPENTMRWTDDVWDDLDRWLGRVATEIAGPYGEVLRAALAISATDSTLSDSLTTAFANPARANLLERLQAAVADGQISAGADLNAVVDLLMAIIVFIGASRDDVSRIPAALMIVRSGISTAA